MRRIARVRAWLVGGVVLLLLVLAGLLGYGRYRAHRFLADIPRRLGIDIKSETNGFTLSQSSKGHTLFTVHAAKAIQRENGKTTLHDVAITLFGPKGSNRTDSIRGEEFEYDQPNGVVRATGDVHLDLAAPTPNGAAAKPAAKRIEVTTRGLVFLQKLGIAATDEPLELVYGDLHGSATGADYESDTGLLRLRNDVRLDGEQNGDRVHMDAAAAELDRNARIATLHTAHLATQGGQASGDRMTLLLRKDGGVEQVDADGNVVLNRGNGVRAQAPRLHARMSLAGKLEQAAMTGGVRLQNGADTASATEALVQYSSAGVPERVDLRHAVRVETANPRADSSTGARNTLTADLLHLQLLQNGKRTELRDAVASGGAELRTVASGASTGRSTVAATGKKPVVRTTMLSADTLHGITAVDGGVRFLSAIEGSGNTRLDERDSAGNVRTSSGDTLHMDLLPRSKVLPGSASGALQRAVQTGHVVVTQHTVPDAGTARGGKAEPQDSRATAARATFDSATQRLVLTGSPVVTAPGAQLAADRIELAQGTGDAVAEGAVKGTLVQGTAADAVHVIAARAALAGSGGLAHFFGGDRTVRMWSSTTQLQAPEIELDRGKGTLLAHPAAGGKGPVQLLFAASAASAVPAASTAQSGLQNAKRAGNVLVTGDEITMTGATAEAPGKVEVAGDVHVVSDGSDLRARHAVATLKPAAQPANPAAAKASAASTLSGGSVQSILATGDVRLQQPGRSGTGERLLYTEADSRYELTGTPADPPTLTDSLRGNVTGTTLIFHGGDDSVEVAGEAGRRVHTETHVARPLRSR